MKIADLPGHNSFLFDAVSPLQWREVRPRLRRSRLGDHDPLLHTLTPGALQQRRPQVGLDGVVVWVCSMEPHVVLLPESPCFVIDDEGRRLVAEPPGEAHAVLDVLQEALATLKGRVVIQGRPYLLAHLLRRLRWVINTNCSGTLK